MSVTDERIEQAQRQGSLFVPDRPGDAYDQVSIDYERQRHNFEKRHGRQSMSDKYWITLSVLVTEDTLSSALKVAKRLALDLENTSQSIGDVTWDARLSEDEVKLFFSHMGDGNG